MRRLLASLAVAGVLASVGLTASVRADDTDTARPLITERVDEGTRTVLAGNTRPEVSRATDLGALPDATPMSHMLLQLKRAPEREQALQRFIDALYDPASPQFHHWLEPATFGARFGLAAADRRAITAWLTGHGFTVNVVYQNGVLIDFSGTAGQIRTAFHTEIHALDVRGVHHIANMTDPEIPAALASAVEGIVALHDFTPHSMMKRRPAYTFNCDGDKCHDLVPADLATIYNLNAAFKAGYTGKGETVAVIEDTSLFKAADWTTFRTKFGLNAYTSGALVVVNPKAATGTNNCIKPDVNGDESEAMLDAEWASAAAPNATIEVVACKNTTTADGLLVGFQNLIDAKVHPSVVSISYGDCEADNGAASNAAYNKAYQQGVTENVSIFVSSGDELAASCDGNDNNPVNATHGIGISALASTVYNVAVGGTDFGDTFDGTSNKFWGANSTTFGSAKSYIPEIPWNGSCASVLVAEYNSNSGSGVTYGTKGFCNTTIAKTDEWLELVGGSGGPSGCATGKPSVADVVSGTCKGYAKPSWQKLAGNPADGVRDIPDVSLFASNAIWDEIYVYCDSDTGDQGAVCTGAPASWSQAGGTSFSSPILAGIQALVNQKIGEAQGNPNPVYYQLARTEYGASGSTACNSTKVTSTSCVFYDITRGDIDMNCTGTHDCYLPSGKYGVLSTSDSAYKIAYGTTKGWDFSTGIGSVNVYNLILKWPSAPAAKQTATAP